MGSVLSPLSAFLLLQGIETVALRVERYVENGWRVAEFLRDDPRVGWVNYAGYAASCIAVTPEGSSRARDTIILSRDFLFDFPIPTRLVARTASSARL
jgi:O-acetylhomoserine/O-acetylserine sulfhydrylase-like pyridoxal-dependent enzyme